MSEESVEYDLMNNGARPPGAFRVSPALIYSLSTMDPEPGFAVDENDRIYITVTVEGQVYDPATFSDENWHAYGPASWKFYVTDASAISVTFGLEVEAQYGLPDAPMSAAVTGLSGSDADQLDKYISEGRTEQANALLADLLA